MKLNKKTFNISLLLVVTILIVSVFLIKNNSKVLSSKKEETKFPNTLSIMVETGIGTGIYEVSESSGWPEGYIFNESLSRCENGSKLSWDSTNNKVVLTGNASDKCYVYFNLPYYIDEVCSSGTNLATCISNFYDATGEGSVGLYKHDGLGTYGEYEAGDNSIRYSGANPNNFVCFGNGATTNDVCPNDNLYRIIGTFVDNNTTRVKLIKYDYANSDLLGTESASGVGEYNSSTFSGVATYKGNKESVNRYYWNKASVSYTCDNESSCSLTNIWKDSKLNTLHLNTNYLNNIGSTWANKIDLTTWKVGGGDDNSIKNAKIKTTYTNEITNTGTTGRYLVSAQKIYYSDTAPTSKIGLMYISDYGYATDPTIWNTYNLGEYTITNNVTPLNWMYMGLNEWAITRQSGSLTGMFAVYATGNAYTGNASGNFFYAVRPVFYLVSNTTINGQHKGTIGDPIRIN